MLTVVVGLSSAIVFGVADFLGGMSSKRLGAVLATGVAAATGIVLFVALALVLPGTLSTEALAFGALSGVLGAIAIGLLYACLAIGPMSILSPLTAVVSAIVPLGVAIADGETIPTVGWIGLAIGLVAIVLVGVIKEERAVRPTIRGLLMAVGSGIAIGGFLIVIDRAPDDSGVWPMIANRATNATIMLTLAAVLALIALARSRRSGVHRERRSAEAWRRGLLLAVVCGVVDALANAGLLLGVRIGDLSVMAVLTALYPIGTIALARVVLKERIALLQYVGLALALVASALLALA